MPRPDQVAELLIDVELHLRQLGLWQAESPPAEAFESTQPFFIDTLDFEQWLQFVFLPTMYQLIEDEADFPTECAIAPMAEEYFRGSALPSYELEITLARVDRLLTEG
ncbi:MAG: YqcC family protein [Halieaceae bacterium]|nr:YqcC family protein [Halieaceae bacterium]